MANVPGKWQKKKDMSVWRRISLNTWKNPDNATIYGRVDVDASKLQEYLKQKFEKTGVKCSATHAVTRAVAMGLRKYPDCNVLVRRRKIWLRRDVDIFLQVAMPTDDKQGKADLSGAIIRRADTKPVEGISTELKDKALDIRMKKDGKMAKTRKTMKSLPNFLLKLVLKIIGWLQYTLNLKVPTTPRDPFGSAMVSSIGSLGLKMAYAPLVTFSHCPIVVLVGEIEDKPVVRNGKIEIRPICTLTATLDHRVLDGFQGAKLASDVQRYLENPELLDREPETTLT
jgi:pyruvate/2-oxoglutarate dehydrogenase complex dihydrolipoamide acyltransferase (E2) component